MMPRATTNEELKKTVSRESMVIILPPTVENEIQQIFYTYQKP